MCLFVRRNPSDRSRATPVTTAQNSSVDTGDDRDDPELYNVVLTKQTWQARVAPLHNESGGVASVRVRGAGGASASASLVVSGAYLHPPGGAADAAAAGGRRRGEDAAAAEQRRQESVFRSIEKHATNVAVLGDGARDGDALAATKVGFADAAVDATPPPAMRVMTTPRTTVVSPIRWLAPPRVGRRRPPPAALFAVAVA